MEETHTLYFRYGQEPVVEVFTGSKGGSTAIILLNGNSFKQTLFVYHRLLWLGASEKFHMQWTMAIS